MEITQIVEIIAVNIVDKKCLLIQKTFEANNEKFQGVYVFCSKYPFLLV